MFSSTTIKPKKEENFKKLKEPEERKNEKKLK